MEKLCLKKEIIGKSETHSEPSQTSEIERFGEIVNG